MAFNTAETVFFKNMEVFHKRDYVGKSVATKDVISYKTKLSMVGIDDTMNFYYLV